MAIVQFRFDGEAPTEPQIREALCGQLGPRARRAIDSVEVESADVSITSQDYVALIYAWKVCVDLGGQRVGSEAARSVPLPSWTSIPWTEHSWISRLSIRFGRLRF